MSTNGKLAEPVSLEQAAATARQMEAADTVLTVPASEVAKVARRLLGQWSASFGLAVEADARGGLIFRGSPQALSMAGLLDDAGGTKPVDERDIATLLQALDNQPDIAPDDRQQFRAIFEREQARAAIGKAARTAGGPDMGCDARAELVWARGHGHWKDRDLLKAVCAAADVRLTFDPDGCIVGITGPARTTLPTLENWVKLRRGSTEPLQKAAPEVRHVQKVQSSRFIERDSRGQVIGIHEL